MNVETGKEREREREKGKKKQTQRMKGKQIICNIKYCTLIFIFLVTQKVILYYISLIER